MALAVLAAIGAASYSRALHRPDDPEADRRVRQAALEQELALLRARLRALEQRTPQAPLGPAAAQAEPSAAPAVALPHPRRAPPATAEDQRHYFEALEARHAGEARDPAWAEPTEQKLRESAEGLGTRLTIESARCGREMCRLNINRQVDPEAEATATLQELVRRVVRVLPAALVQNTDDPARLVVYLVREGAEGFPPLVGREPDPAP